jgi:hypothetical protein
MFFNKIKEKISRQKVSPIVVLIFCISIILALIFREYIAYWMYYKPFYTLFKNSIYLPLYLYGGGYLLFAIIINIISIKHRETKLRSKIIIIVITIVLLFFLEINVYKDLLFTANEKYLKTECNINSLARIRSIGSGPIRYYKIYSNIEIDRNILSSIEMDFYQYSELKKLQAENKNKIIIVYYLPNTEKMLKYE